MHMTTLRGSCVVRTSSGAYARDHVCMYAYMPDFHIHVKRIHVCLHVNM